MVRSKKRLASPTIKQESDDFDPSELPRKSA